ncbi:MAG: rRNA maturation RNase YbeY [Thermoguttaceae bacterium]|nr:rRNA maturation RNase YbeY [Thermoguttaceae bacterium]
MPDNDVQFAFIDEQSRLTVDFERMRRAISKILADADYRRGSIEIAAIAAEPMHEMNRQFLGHDYVTDVLAFALEDDRDKGLIEGNIVVCSDYAVERAPDYGWAPEDELLMYAIHGALHLVGYDDHTPEDAPIMHAKEREYLEYVGVDARNARYGE